jgi:hypothetical protein
MSLQIWGGGDHEAEKYRNVVADLVQSYKAMGCSMSLKVQFLDSHLELFQENLRAASDEHGERFRQEISYTEKRCQGK